MGFMQKSCVATIAMSSSQRSADKIRFKVMLEKDTMSSPGSSKGGLVWFGSACKSAACQSPTLTPMHCPYLRDSVVACPYVKV